MSEDANGPRRRDELPGLLPEQVAYYRAPAPEYEAGALDALGLPGGHELYRAFEVFRPPRTSSPACVGAGTWTE
jgi:hypothetical protein